MTLVDDYEPVFKLRGILAMTGMLERVDASLLKRTGLDVLLLNVCNDCHSVLFSVTALNNNLSQSSHCQRR
jgi:hypothetical protein